MEAKGLTPNQWLAYELAERRAQNPKYSLRMMATKVGVSPGRLSEFVTGKRPVTKKTAERISDRLGYSFEKRKRFLRTFTAVELARKFELTQNYRQLEVDTFQVIADWQHYAILTLMDVDDFRSEPEWIANRLGITEKLVIESLRRLEATGLIENKDGVLKKANPDIATTTDIPSAALKLSHKQNLQQGIDAIDEVAIELRDITSITMAVDVNRLKEAKELIRRFRYELCEFMEAGPKNEVYNLNIQLIPVTKVGREK